MSVDLIPNHVIRYFRMVTAQTFYGKAENNGSMSRDGMNFIFSIFKCRPINSADFLLDGLDRVENEKVENIYMGGTVTHISIALGLRNQVAHLTPWCGYGLLVIDHCLNRGLVRREGLDKYKIVILGDIVHQSTLPNPEKTCKAMKCNLNKIQ